MEEDAIVKHLWGLRKVNDALVAGLKTALLTMESWDKLSPERRQSTMESLKELIRETRQAYGRKIPEDKRMVEEKKRKLSFPRQIPGVGILLNFLQRGIFQMQ